MEEVSLRQLEANLMFPYTYSGNLNIEDLTHRLYNDTDQPRIIKMVRASVGVAATGRGVVVDVKKNGSSIFDPTNPAAPVGSSAKVYIAPNQNTGTSQPVSGTVWSVGEYLTVGITQIGSTFPGADLTISVVVSE